MDPLLGSLTHLSSITACALFVPIEVAEKVFDKCIEVKKPDENSQAKITDKFEVVFNFEFLDDLYTVTTWKEKASSLQKRKEKLKELSKYLYKSRTKTCPQSVVSSFHVYSSIDSSSAYVFK